MTYSQLMQTYMGVGTLASRPSSPNVASGVAAFYYGTDTSALYTWDGSAWHTISGISSSSYVCLQEQQPSGTQGGTFTAGSWQTRQLNTIVSDTDGVVVSLAAGQFVLEAGSYRVFASAPGHLVNRHQARLYNVTAAAVLLTGTNARARDVESAQTDSLIAGRFTVAAAQTLELQHQCGGTEATDGFGNPCAFDLEVYSQIALWQE